MTKPKVGERYRFAFDYGTDPGTIRAGTVAEVVEVVSAKDPGAGDDQSESFVLQWDEKQPIMVDDEPQVATTSRRWAATAEAFGGLVEKEK